MLQKKEPKLTIIIAKPIVFQTNQGNNTLSKPYQTDQKLINIIAKPIIFQTNQGNNRLSTLPSSGDPAPPDILDGF